MRWLTRRSRIPASLRLALAVILGAAGVMGIAVPASSRAGGPLTAIGGPPSASPNAPAKSPEPPGAGNPTKSFPHSASLLLQGKQLYEQSCSSCHGIALQGQPGVAPSLVGVGAGPVDFYLSTGRMPLANPRAQPLRARPKFGRAEINAIVDYVSMFGGPAAPTANPAHGSLSVGQSAFTLHCAGCHQIVGRGGMTVGAQVPDLQQATPQQIAEAVRMGPYLMPHFDAHQIDQHDLDSIARYVLWTRHPTNAGGWGIYNIGPIPEGIVAWFVALLALVIVARLIGEIAASPSPPRPSTTPEV
ncbi:MAG TPA: c-type cytochrome [Solirubrobacteraceae bacterium]|nr:c-type cytochrome [Solirubrobacteraceae bacterium]